MIYFYLALVSLALTGCGRCAVLDPLCQYHPANPEIEIAPVPLPNTLEIDRAKKPETQTQQHQHQAHE